MDLRRQERNTAAGDGSKMSDRRCPRQPLPVAAAIENIDFEGKLN